MVRAALNPPEKLTSACCVSTFLLFVSTSAGHVGCVSWSSLRELIRTPGFPQNIFLGKEGMQSSRQCKNILMTVFFLDALRYNYSLLTVKKQMSQLHVQSLSFIFLTVVSQIKSSEQRNQNQKKGESKREINSVCQLIHESTRGREI